MAAEALDCTTPVVSEAFETLEADSHAEDGKNAGIGPVACETDPGSAKKLIMDSPRAEIDMSVPFLSVKEAANRFGGMGFWRPPSHKLSECESEVVDIAQVEEEAVQLEKVLMEKERETLDVLKELQTAKMNVEELKLKLQKEASEVSATLNANLDGENVNHSLEVAEERENHKKLVGGIYNSNDAFSPSPSSVLGFILMELKQAKLNLTRTSDLSGIRATVQLFNQKIEIERLALEKTRRRLSLKSSKISSLEEEVNKTRLMLQMAPDSDIKDNSNNPIDISRELQQLSSEAERYRKIGEEGKSEVLRAMSAIEHTKTGIKTTEMELVAAKKIKEVSRATEVVDVADDFKPVLRPKLSIGKILSRKLSLTEEFGNGMKSKKGCAVKRKMSLRQMFSRPNHETLFNEKAERENGHNQLPVKRKMFRFLWFSVLERE